MRRERDRLPSLSKDGSPGGVSLCHLCREEVVFRTQGCAAHTAPSVVCGRSMRSGGRGRVLGAAGGAAAVLGPRGRSFGASLGVRSSGEDGPRRAGCPRLTPWGDRAESQSCAVSSLPVFRRRMGEKGRSAGTTSPVLSCRPVMDPPWPCPACC